MDRYERIRNFNMYRPLTAIEIIKQTVLVTLGSLVMAAGLELFLIPNRMVDGGMVGVSIMVSHLTGIKLGSLIFLLNTPFFLLGLRQFGALFAFFTLYATTALSIFVDAIQPVESLSGNLPAAVVFGGLTLGIGSGLVLRYGGSLDGTEILAILLNKETRYSVGEIIMFLNLFILGSASFIFGWLSCVYSLLVYFIAFKTIDFIIKGT